MEDSEELTPMINQRFGLAYQEEPVKLKGKVASRAARVHAPSSNTFLARWAVPIVLCYLALGMVVFERLEKWSLRDALYFSVTLLTTVGYGDLAPKTSVAKVFCCAYVLFGVSMVSASLGVVLGRMQASISRMESNAGINHSTTLWSACASVACVVCLGSTFVHLTEGWSPLDSMYWAVITCTSVGLGDLSTAPATRVVNSVYMLIAVGTFAGSAASIVHAFAEMEIQQSVAAFIAEGVTEDIIAEMDEDGGGSVDKYEFLSYMLVHTGKATKHEIQSLDSLFASLDRDGSGSLDQHDIRAAVSKSGGDSTPTKKRAQYAAKKQQQLLLVCFASVWRLLAKLVQEALQMLQCHGASYPKIVDALLAASSLAGSLMILHCLETSGYLPFHVYAPPMLASSIIFFGGTHPPPPAAFVTGSLGAFFLGAVLQQLGASGSTVVQCMAAAVLLFFFKLSGSFFVPTVGLCAFLAQSNNEGHSIRMPLSYLIAPWGTGHLILYSAALLLSNLRQNIRVAMTKSEWKNRLGGNVSGPAREQELRKIFDKYDTSGDGALDASELKLALRFVTGSDLDIEDCERIIRSMDTDGDGVIDFHEFMLALDEH